MNLLFFSVKTNYKNKYLCSRNVTVNFPNKLHARSENNKRSLFYGQIIKWFSIFFRTLLFGQNVPLNNIKTGYRNLYRYDNKTSKNSCYNLFHHLVLSRHTSCHINKQLFSYYIIYMTSTSIILTYHNSITIMIIII